MFLTSLPSASADHVRSLSFGDNSLDRYATLFFFTSHALIFRPLSLSLSLSLSRSRVFESTSLPTKRNWPVAYVKTRNERPFIRLFCHVCKATRCQTRGMEKKGLAVIYNYLKMKRTRSNVDLYFRRRLGALKSGIWPINSLSLDPLNIVRSPFEDSPRTLLFFTTVIIPGSLASERPSLSPSLSFSFFSDRNHQTRLSFSRESIGRWRNRDTTRFHDFPCKPRRRAAQHAGTESFHPRSRCIQRAAAVDGSLEQSANNGSVISRSADPTRPTHYPNINWKTPVDGFVRL